MMALIYQQKVELCTSQETYTVKKEYRERLRRLTAVENSIIPHREKERCILRKRLTLFLCNDDSAESGLV